MRKAGVEEVYRLHVNDIYRYLRKLTGDAGLAEDLTQETFFRAFQHLDTYRGEKVRPWLFKVAYHAFIDWHRKQKRKPEYLTDAFPDQADQRAASPEAAVVLQETFASVQDALDALPEKQRQSLLLYAGKLSYAEISDVLGIDVADVKRSLYRGRVKMRKWWRDNQDDRCGQDE
ncbi:sigma-70 family RNA polymerase sigma factor [Brevibacillus ruminantium]|uniref:Sigma-70 family RNA polymerase sigma factor n=1 Tax=Brevibacillus ruminantium TaxID=2950604 RepID=A0ABY4WKR2_9BACL|nr:sigma-70 family RNA polymerase sigma factor [Brevibacillus ruminantium]USG66728.1 sigma-70 family RNA polymerase sigma factor [Brevibacillus ruminantium]